MHNYNKNLNAKVMKRVCETSITIVVEKSEDGLFWCY